MLQSQEERVHASALRSLNMRAHSVYELRRKLIKKGMDESIIEGVLSRLEKVGLLDDRDFAMRYVEYGLLRKSWGMVKVKASLREKGVPKEIIDEVFWRSLGQGFLSKKNSGPKPPKVKDQRKKS